MSSLITLLIYVGIIVSLVKNIQKKRQKPGGQNPDRNPVSMMRSAERTRTFGNSGENRNGSRSGSMRQTDQKAVNRRGMDDPSMRTSVSGSGSGSAAFKEESLEMSTTEYLNRKAMQDQQEHRKEKYLEIQRARKETGGIPQAVRLYEGDSVPRGMQCVKCGYCHADNLIPEGSRAKYTCYFCREEL